MGWFKLYRSWSLFILCSFHKFSNFTVRWSDGIRCCRSDWPGLCFCVFCCYQPSCVNRVYFGLFFLFVSSIFQFHSSDRPFPFPAFPLQPNSKLCQPCRQNYCCVLAHEVGGLYGVNWFFVGGFCGGSV